MVHTLCPGFDGISSWGQSKGNWSHSGGLQSCQEILIRWLPFENIYCLSIYTKGAFFWGYSGSSYSSLGITEYTEFQFRKECSLCFRSGNRIRGDQTTTISVTGTGGCVGFPAKTFPKEYVFCLIQWNSVHSAIGSRMNGTVLHSSRKRNSSQKNKYTVYSEYSYSGIVPKEHALRNVS